MPVPASTRRPGKLAHLKARASAASPALLRAIIEKARREGLVPAERRPDRIRDGTARLERTTINDRGMASAGRVRPGITPGTGR